MNTVNGKVSATGSVANVGGENERDLKRKRVAWEVEVSHGRAKRSRYPLAYVPKDGYEGREYLMPKAVFLRRRRLVEQRYFYEKAKASFEKKDFGNGFFCLKIGGVYALGRDDYSFLKLIRSSSGVSEFIKLLNRADEKTMYKNLAFSAYLAIEHALQGDNGPSSFYVAKVLEEDSTGEWAQWMSFAILNITEARIARLAQDLEDKAEELFASPIDVCAQYGN